VTGAPKFVLEHVGDVGPRGACESPRSAGDRLSWALTCSTNFARVRDSRAASSCEIHYASSLTICSSDIGVKFQRSTPTFTTLS
jgi:hypothetical protein